ncbi:hypothetical protein IVA86_14420 [Bradyrhizobium sp. 146]|uniref:hypothetical protein n=1 Tax=Bradyrhizobium sp. 146 TaxID=2782622 RepID=UPI001FF8246A|nr:hypothetical protein [Bradyrhizobium sp. 146]MCK1702593.1 hypothetical protein [Bradyrhizobium sp. 146]
MTDHLEAMIQTEARQQGYQPNAEAMMQAAVDLAGSVLTDQGLIHLPGRGSISPADFVRDLHGRMPSAFASLADERRAETKTGNLTEQMRQEVAASRRQRMLPRDWLAVRSKSTGTTAEHMAEREGNWK